MKIEDIKKIANNEWGDYQVYGKSFKYNNLVQNGNFESTANWNATNGTINVSNNVLTYKITSIGSDLESNRINQNAPAVSHKGFVKVSIKVPYDTVVRIYDTNFRVLGTALANKWTDLYYFSSSLQNNHLYFDVFSQSSYQISDEIQVKKYQKSDLTEIFGDGNEPTTLEQFYATDLGKAIQNGFYPPYSATNTIYSATSPFKFERGVEMTSLVGKQNIPATLTATSSYNALNLKYTNTFALGFGTSDKRIEFIPNNKYLIAIKFENYDSSFNLNSLIKYSFHSSEELTYGNFDFIDTNEKIIVGIVNATNTRSPVNLTMKFGDNLNKEFTVKYQITLNLTDIGLDNLTAQQFYDQYNHLFDKLANGETVFKPQTVSILQNGQPLKLGGIGTAKDYYLNASGKVNRAIGNVDLGSLVWQYDSVNIRFHATFQLWKTYSNWPTIPAKILCNKYTTVAFNSMPPKDKCIAYYSGYRLYAKDTDYTDAPTFKSSLNGVILHYELATPTTEQANSVMLRKGFTKITDANGLELEFEDKSDILNFSSKIVNGKTTPAISAERIITKGFTSGGEHFTQLYIYDDGEIWYVNGGSSAQAYVPDIGWELEYKQLQFDSGVRLTNQERNALLNIYDLV